LEPSAPTGETPNPPAQPVLAGEIPAPRERPLVLLSNDDGITAPGLGALREALAKHADVIVCAPEANQSATSHSLSLHRILRLRHAGASLFALDGTPADCVYVALHSGTRVLPRRPDLVVSGMNHGLNLGIDVFYSGTVAAAREAALRGIPSVAVSADSGADRAAAARLGASLAMAALAAFQDLPAGSPRPPTPLLNVNIPPGDAWSVRATCLGARLYAEDVDYRRDPRGREYLWIGGAGAVRHDHVPGSDTEAYDAGIASVTPLSLDLWAGGGASLAARVAGALPR
jgi:5'-nucleotidase